MTLIIPVILSGGAGTRLWPLSTLEKPKQFHALHSEATMFADTLARVRQGQDLAFGPPIILCGKDHLAPVASELREAGITSASIILEPLARNTAPAIAAAALLQAQTDPEALMLVLPADHVIEQPENLHQACIDARAVAASGKIVTFAIKPLSPETGYGYIKSGKPLAEGVFGVEAFKEKPDLATAQSYLAAGNYAWNAGIFYFKASALIAELEKHAPEVLHQVRAAIQNADRDDNVIGLDGEAFAAAPSISFDYAIMEPTQNAAVVPVDMGWNDVGSFATLWDLGRKDEAGNVARGEVALFDSHNNYVNTSGIPVALIGVSDLLVVSTPRGLLITTREHTQNVRLAADKFKL
jgi:mannose-1-phosphate guanylyltransferase / mannose-6-phosphate isomerase